MDLKTNALIIEEFGSTEVLNWQATSLTPPKENELTIRHEAIGINFIDIYHRKGIFAAPLSLPSGLGMEGAGIVEAIGEDVRDFSIGDRIAYAGGPPGAYSTVRNIPSARAIKIPNDISSKVAAAFLFKGLTAEYLIRRCYKVKPSDTVLLHAAAGGVGQIASQWLNHIGATVIGTIGSVAKSKLALDNGCDYALVHSDLDFKEQVLEITNNKGADVVYDSIGKTTFADSLSCVKERGTVVSFGESSGPVEPFNISQLGAKGSLYLTRPSIAHYTSNRLELEEASEVVFNMIRQNVFNTESITTYPLTETSQAHQDLEDRKTSGALVLIP